jgi:hypothetical protein
VWPLGAITACGRPWLFICYECRLGFKPNLSRHLTNSFSMYGRLLDKVPCHARLTGGHQLPTLDAPRVSQSCHRRGRRVSSNVLSPSTPTHCLLNSRSRSKSPPLTCGFVTLTQTQQSKTRHGSRATAARGMDAEGERRFEGEDSYGASCPIQQRLSFSASSTRHQWWDW